MGSGLPAAFIRHPADPSEAADVGLLRPPRGHADQAVGFRRTVDLTGENQ
jgi:hypothetical protein